MLFLESDKNNEKLDIIILTENWHDVLNNCNYSIDGYKLFFSTINILSICRSPSTDIRSFIETLSKVIKEYKHIG